jgi:SAM-dependent MidA family methyltransferase
VAGHRDNVAIVPASEPRQSSQIWRTAWHDALLGPAGFYSTGPGSLSASGPAGHFRTSAVVGQGQAVAAAILAVLTDVDIRLGHPERLEVIEIGAGEGTLANSLMSAIAADSSGSLSERVRMTCIDVHERPVGLIPSISWITGPAHDVLKDTYAVNGLVVAHEWFDTIACDVLQVDADRHLRVVLVDAAGVESLGPRLVDAQACAQIGVDSATITDWVDRWWPLAGEPGQRIEVGLTRDDTMRTLTKAMMSGTILAIDYGHDVNSRRSTLAGYRNGRLVSVIPDGSCDITAHVAFDSCAQAAKDIAETTGRSIATSTRLQREVLGPLVALVRWPDPASANSNPEHYATELESMSNVIELTGPDLGDFTWLRVDIA